MGRSKTVLTALAVVGVVAVVAVLGVLTVLSPRDERDRIVAEFAQIDGVYPGTQVRILGIVVGSVEDARPAGDRVRVEMTVEEGTQLPADVGAVVMNPAVIADRFVELTPAYTGGETFDPGGVIGVERTRSPLDYDAFLSSLDTVSSAFAPESEAAGRALDRGAGVLADRGPELNAAIRDLSTVSTVVGNRSDEIGAVVDELAVLMTAAGGRDETLRELVGGMADLGEQLGRDDVDVGGSVEGLRVILDELDELMIARGEDITVATEATRETVEAYAGQTENFAEFLDVYPLMMDNLARSIGPDGRANIRLNITTNISQFAAGRQFCEANPMPICSGVGFTNPLMYPVEASDPLGLGHLSDQWAGPVLGGGAPDEDGGG